MKYVFQDRRNDGSIFPLVFFESGSGAKSEMHKIIGVSFHSWLLVIKNGFFEYYCVKGDSEKISKFILDKIKNNPELVEQWIKKTYELGKELLDFTSNISLDDKNNNDLWNYYDKYSYFLKKARGYAWFVNGLEINHGFSKVLESIILAKCKNVEKYLPILTWTDKKTNVLKMHIKMLEMKRDGVDLDLLEKEFSWIPCGYQNEPWSKGYFENELAKIINPEKELEKIEQDNMNNKKKREDAIKELNLTLEEIQLFNIASELIFFKPNRKDIFFKSYFDMRPLLKEIAKRVNMTIEEVRFLLPIEVKESLLEGKKFNLSERMKYCIMFLKEGETKLVDENFLLENVELDKIELSSELKGTCAYTGNVKGSVKLILSPKDMHKMNEGDILISDATNPDILSAMKLASAIVTNTGGITCHAAIVSRELNIPCVIGTKVATKAFKDGDYIEVDADNGMVRKLS